MSHVIVHWIQFNPHAYKKKRVIGGAQIFDKGMFIGMLIRANHKCKFSEGTVTRWNKEMNTKEKNYADGTFRFDWK